MSFSPIIAATRFGTGLSPHIAPPTSVASMLALLTGPDTAAIRVPITGFWRAEPKLVDLRNLRRAEVAARNTAGHQASREAVRDAVLIGRQSQLDDYMAMLTRGATTSDGLRERLAAFWADHFTVRAKNQFTRHLVGPYVESAIRPVMTGSFETLLKTAVLHPMMIDYLDQSRSIGPQSYVAQNSGGGLNENLARELMELHTLGVDGPYAQADVRELAELLTGLFWNPDRLLEYLPRRAEPGAETVLGQTFSAQPEMETVEAALSALAAHPATGWHICTKLAVHFVSDTPAPALIVAMVARWNETKGNLLAVYEAMLTHPDAWHDTPEKVKPPVAYIMSSLRALGLGSELAALDPALQTRHLLSPLRVMGQAWERPTGPDGWPEAAQAWITPQFLAGRINWAMIVPHHLMTPLPDPRAFVYDALGPMPPDDTVFAARAAETRAVGIGVVLASSAFQRR